MAIVSDTRFIQKQIEDIGNTCTIREVTTTMGTDEYRIPSEDSTYHTGIKCFVNILSESDDLVKQGEARAGDLTFWFDYNQESYCVQGNRIQFDSKWYEIYNVHKFDVESNVTQIIECRTRKI